MCSSACQGRPASSPRRQTVARRRSLSTSQTLANGRHFLVPVELGAAVVVRGRGGQDLDEQYGVGQVQVLATRPSAEQRHVGDPAAAVGKLDAGVSRHQAAKRAARSHGGGAIALDHVMEHGAAGHAGDWVLGPQRAWLAVDELVGLVLRRRPVEELPEGHGLLGGVGHPRFSNGAFADHCSTPLDGRRSRARRTQQGGR